MSRKIPQSEWDAIVARRHQGETVASIANSYGCTPPVIYNILNRQKTGATEPIGAEAAEPAAPYEENRIGGHPSEKSEPATMNEGGRVTEESSPTEAPGKGGAPNASAETPPVAPSTKETGARQAGAGETDTRTTGPLFRQAPRPQESRPVAPASPVSGQQFHREGQRSAPLSLGQPRGEAISSRQEGRTEARQDARAEPRQDFRQQNRPESRGRDFQASEARGSESRGSESQGMEPRAETRSATGGGHGEAPLEMRSEPRPVPQPKPIALTAALDGDLRRQADASIESFRAAFDAALRQSNGETNAALLRASSDLMRIAARTTIVLERLAVPIRKHPEQQSRDQTPVQKGPGPQGQGDGPGQRGSGRRAFS